MTGSLLRRSLFLALACLALQAAAQGPSALLYDGADRNDKLTAAAAKEATLTLYTAFRPQDLPAILGPFEKKTGIKVKAWRSGSNNVTQRVLTEAGGKRFEVDAIMMPAQEMEAVRREQILQPVYSPYQKDLMPGALPVDHQSATVLMNVVVQVYNTRLLKKQDLPRSYQDLLDPKWKSKLGIEAKAEEWYATVVLAMGEEKGVRMFRDMVAKNGISARLGVSLLNNLVVSGEVPLALTVYIDLPEKGKREGKPIDWFGLDPVVAHGFNIALARRAPHPNAALLFYDYMLSPETQKLLASLLYYPASTKAASQYPGLHLKVVDPVYAVDNAEKWMKSFEDAVIKQAR